ncbi:MAG: hypothetical protein A3E84_02105 [Gammaproteobacteria bacterium RIFCSPHIGHO2_12_FULL_42_13]|nr:MAG: hypothetical protein A3E84_02105 [Gammaproteobacteria bacterium RIFCSPHIGHO2_12_FULL_42_13]
MKFKTFGALYLILGTCIAAGMLGLPIVSAEAHFLATFIMLLCAWALMTGGAWCLLQVNLRMPLGVNFITMSEKTLGRLGKTVTWVIYLLFMLSLLCAYLSASSDLLHVFFESLRIPVPRSLCTVIAVIILGGVVYRGISTVDMINRFLMSAKLFICFIVMIAVFPHSHLSNLPATHWRFNGDTLLVMITAFGYATILPSIRDYLGDDRKKLLRIFLGGSLIPITLYLIWILLIQGALPSTELVAMNHSANTNSLLMHALASLTHHPIIESISIMFVSICSITGFLGTSLAFVDALRDGMHDAFSRLSLLLIALFPPMLVVIFYPAIFIQALAYAGMCCLYLLVLLPVMMYVACALKERKK